MTKPSKLDIITARWARMWKNTYNIGVLEGGLEGATYSPLTEPMLVVYCDREPGVDGAIPATAVCGPRSDPASLEDAIAYAEAPEDVRYLLAEINRLKAILLAAGLSWAAKATTATDAAHDAELEARYD